MNDLPSAPEFVTGLHHKCIAASQHEQGLGLERLNPEIILEGSCSAKHLVSSLSKSDIIAFF